MVSCHKHASKKITFTKITLCSCLPLKQITFFFKPSEQNSSGHLRSAAANEQSCSTALVCKVCRNSDTWESCSRTEKEAASYSTETIRGEQITIWRAVSEEIVISKSCWLTHHIFLQTFCGLTDHFTLIIIFALLIRCIVHVFGPNFKHKLRLLRWN